MRAGIAVVSVVSMLCGCLQSKVEERVLLELRAPDGRRIGDVVSRASESVILVHDVGTALSCAAEWEQWREWQRADTSRRLLLVLTERPNRSDIRILAIRRMSPITVLRNSDRSMGRAQAEYYVAAGALVAVERDPQRVGVGSSLLAKLRMPPSDISGDARSSRASTAYAATKPRE